MVPADGEPVYVTQITQCNVTGVRVCAYAYARFDAGVYASLLKLIVGDGQ